MRQKLSSGPPPRPPTSKTAIIHFTSHWSSADPDPAMAVPHKLLHAENGTMNLTSQEADLILGQTRKDQSFNDLVKAAVMVAVAKPPDKGTKGK